MVEPLMRAKDVVRLLGISKSYLYLLVQRREIPVVRFGSSMRFREEDLLVFIDQHIDGINGDVTSDDPSLY